MSAYKKSLVSTISRESENGDTSSPLFPYSFVFRSRDELNDHIANKLTSNRVVHDIKLTLGPLTFVLPLMNLFMVYRGLIYQETHVSDVYSIFHSIIFYSEFIIVHLLLISNLILFVFHDFKAKKSFSPSKGQWISFLDMEFTLMAFNLIKLIPILSYNGYTFILLEISMCAPILLKSSRSSRIIGFTILTLIIFIELILLVGSLLLITLIKVYQVAFVGEVSNPLNWNVNQWLLFIGFAANIINITDTPTISQLSFMWSLTNKTWSEDSSIWLHDRLGEKRKAYILDQICQTLGFFKTFLWVRTMTGGDVHAIVRLPPSVEDRQEHV